MIGRTISHYRVLERLGGGGMGVVYRAEDVKLRRTVALKFLAPELTRDEDSKRRFIHEAQAASALDHPNICSIFDIDETPEGQLFIAMACYDGESLKQRIERRKLDVSEAFEIAFSVGQGLVRAHAGGIIHRDIKPGNVMITGDGFVKIVDFGLAKLIGRSRVTGSGVTLGTVAYMAPEQTQGEDVDARADVWALGALLYEMLTGKIPFRGEIDQAVVYSIQSAAPTPIRELRAEVPEACVQVVMKCLEKDPERRYQTVAEFCNALIELSERLGWGSFATGSVRAVSVVRRVGRRRRRIAVPVIIACTVAAVGAGAWWHWGHHSIYSTKVRLAVMPLERPASTPSQAFVDGLSQWISEAFDRASRDVPSVWVLSYAKVLEDRPADLSRVGGAFGVNRLITGNVQPFGDGQRVTLTLMNAETLQPVRSAFVEFDPETPDSLTDHLANAALTLLDRHADRNEHTGVAGPRPAVPAAFLTFLEGSGYSQGKSAGHLEDAERALDASITQDGTFAPAFVVRGRVRSKQTHNPAALDLALADLEAAIALDSTYVPGFLGLASVYEGQRRFDLVAQSVRHALRVDPASVDAYQALGRAYAMQGRYDEARTAYSQVVGMRPDYYLGYYALGWVARMAHASDVENAANRRALELAPGDWRSLIGMGSCQADAGNWAAAREYFERAFLIHPDCSSCAMAGWVLYYEGRFADAARYYEYALGYCDSTNYKHWGNVACALYWADGERDRGIAAYRRAIDLAERSLTEKPDDPEIIGRLADYYAMIDDRPDAYRMIERARDITGTDVAYRLACAYEKLGERKEALDKVGEALRGRFPLRQIEMDPLFRDLIRDPRYRPLAEAAVADGEKASP